MTEPLTEQGSIDDWLGYGAYADALWARTVRALDKDKGGKPLGDDPLVIGIFGEWGAGKSHLLKLVYQRAQDQSARDIEARVQHATDDLTVPLTVTVPVMFQPWKYEHEPHLHVPLAIHIADALDDAWKKLPSDIEKVKVWVASATALGKTVNEKIEVVTSTLGKFNAFFQKTKAFVKSDAADVVAGTLDVMATAMLVPPVLSLGLSKVRESLGADDDAADDEPAKPKPAAEKKSEAPKNSNADKKKQEFSHSTDGLAFYRIEKLIRAMTRPKLSKKLLADAGLKIAEGIEFDLRINFVVFVDDLDRCLPEKAVEMLELIKTMFNVESFAFVLALDDEVIERGIGHRYQAYHLAGKKPEMPITGFEYLEKIIHLPFRLPALTRGQAAAFVRKYESDIEPDAALRWFDKPAQAPTNVPTDLLDLALSGFDAFMPRKLIRLVELLHQVAAIARLRQKPLQVTYSGDVDVRVVLVLLLIQLFQPELFRVMRRRADSFPTLLAAFAVRPVLGASTTPEPPDLPNAQMADIDLWRWAVNPKDADVEWKPAPLEPLHGHAAHCISLAFKGKPDERTSRTSAQQVRLPIVLQLIEHRAAQRHVFDVLKLVKRLADEMSRTGSAPHELNFEPYRSLLAQEVESQSQNSASVSVQGSTRGISPPTTASTNIVFSPSLITSPSQPTFSPSNPEELAQLLVSPETEAQANMVSRLELRTGHVLDERSVANLVSSLNAKLTQGTAEDWQTNKVRTLNGLQYLAPFLSPEHAKAMWQLVADCVDLNKPIDPKLRALWGDVRAALGCDPRFQIGRLCLAVKNCEDKPTNFSTVGDDMPGFAKIDSRNKPFWFGDGGDNSGSVVKVSGLDKVFYIARTLTTVDQYKAFVDSEDYAKSFHGDGQKWLTGDFDTKVTEKTLKEWLARRPAGERLEPVDWLSQLKNPLRPVVNVSWFEAHAYTQWLETQLPVFGYDKTRVGLPTELQWECAARFGLAVGAQPSFYPWSGEPATSKSQANDFAQHANLGNLVGTPTTVGIFPRGHSQERMADMAGNVWEWFHDPFIEKFNPNQTAREQISAKYYSVRGGSRINDPDYARCSYRLGSPAHSWVNGVGFRVVLSQPD